MGLVTDIQRFSVHDGPGIRTTVFLKGCDLRCAWCHNPETIHPRPQLQVFPGRCLGCGACVTACRHGARVREGAEIRFCRERCRACGDCVRACAAGALVMVGREMTVDQVLAEVREDTPYYANSGGGMTLSGGEPLCQPDFSRRLLEGARSAGIHTAVETNLATSWEKIENLVPLTDLFLVDLKLADPERHRRWTGKSCEGILENLRRLASVGRPVIVRTPVVPGVNDDGESISAVADRLRQFPSLVFYELIPYHPLGAWKYRSLGMDYSFDGVRPPSPPLLRELAEVASRRGFPVRVAGRKA